MSGSAVRSRGSAWVLLAPMLVIFGVFTVYPLVQSLALSTQRTFGPGTSRFVGMGNFRFLASDPQFWIALKNTAVFAAGSVFIQLPLALGLAILLNRPDVRGRAALRLLFFSPSLVGVVFVGMMAGVIFEKRTGLLNQVLHRAFGVSLEFPWLQTYIMPALILAALWQWVGFNMVYFLAALQNVSAELVEASTIDGARAWSRFKHVVIPAIAPVAGFVVLLSIIGSFQIFELPYVMLNSSSGPESRGLSIVMYLFQTGFDAGDLGYASAIGWVLAILLVVCAIGQRFLSRRAEVAT